MSLQTPQIEYEAEFIQQQSASLVSISPVRMFPVHSTASGPVEEREEEQHLHLLSRLLLPLLFRRRHRPDP